MPSGESDHSRSESLLRAVLDSMSESVVAIDETGAIEFVNRQSEAMFGYSAAELSGRPVECLIPPRFQGIHHRSSIDYLKLDARSPSQMHRVQAVDRAGREFPVDIHLNKARLQDGRRIGIALITDLREPDRLLKQREDFFRVAPDLLATLSPEGLLEEVNPAFTKLLGWCAAELKSRSLSSLSDPEGREVAERSVRAFLSNESARGEAFEIRCACRDGGTRLVHWALHTTESGTRIAAGRDVTKSHQLAVERHKLAALVEDAPMLVAILSAGAELTVQHLNPAGRELLGLTESKPFPATDFRQLFGLDAATARHIEAALAHFGKWSGPVCIVDHRDFTPIPVDLDIVGIADGSKEANPTPTAWGVFARDIRERNRDRELLEESEERFRTLLGQSTDPLIVHDEKGRILEVNRQACQDLGLSGAASGTLEQHGPGQPDHGIRAPAPQERDLYPDRCTCRSVHPARQATLPRADQGHDYPSS
jgi:PAS domain S-box-containing protein